jgi:hypothetical protein
MFQTHTVTSEDGAPVTNKDNASYNEFIIVFSNRQSREMSLGLANKLRAEVRFQQVAINFSLLHSVQTDSEF